MTKLKKAVVMVDGIEREYIEIPDVRMVYKDDLLTQKDNIEKMIAELEVKLAGVEELLSNF